MPSRTHSVQLGCTENVLLRLLRTHAVRASVALRFLFRDERASFLNVKWQRFALHKNFSIQEKVSRIERIYKNIIDL
jgi:hypothetical protein